jgi:uncharacterized membrane protein SpoIIM required for sporulation
MGLLTEVRAVFRRNAHLIGIVSVAFFSILVLSALVAYALLLTIPSFTGFLQNNLASTAGLTMIPPPYTTDLYRLIFLNNIGHFWNPTRVWVWIPFIGIFSLGFELALNAAVIGGVISFVTLTRGAAFTVAGLAPHGVLEIPAFILEFSGLARWHVASIRAIHAKLSGRNVDRPLLKEEVKDSLLLSILAVALFAVAAFVEAYVTPRFLGL